MDENQEGFGLGLAIVKNIAQAHGGEVNMGQSELYGGLSVSIVLPKLSN
jgi:two-component system osmolarity sensor histidine kinase EnvZ